jgi:hypothetical protein
LRAPYAEAAPVFFPLTTPLAVAPVHVQGLRLSLNTPVVATEELPIGPARAAILVHDDPERGPTVTIGIRSLRADRVALYGLESEAGDDTDLEVAVDAALSFAESMGFLFDEDELVGGDAQAKTRCLGLWRDLLGDAGPEPARSPIRMAEPEGELLLEELAEEATEFVLPPASGGGDDAEDEPEIGDFLEEDDEDLGAGAAEDEEDEEGELGAELPDASDALVVAAASKAAAEGVKRPGSVSLTKFRGRSPGRGARAPARAEARSAAARSAPAREAAPEAPQKGRATALGRMRLVRRVRDGLRKRNPILRLFGAF